MVANYGTRPTPSDVDLVAALDQARRVAERMLGPGPDADDVVQETAAALVASRARLDADRLTRYAAVTARNAVIDVARRQGIELPRADLPVTPVDSELPEEAALRQAEWDAVRRGIRDLSPDDQSLLWRSVVDGETAAEVGGTLGRSGRVQSVRLLRARARLRVSTVVRYRHARLPTERCLPVLLAVSARDARRCTDLSAEAHIAACRVCSEIAPVLRRRDRRMLGLAPAALAPAVGAGAAGHTAAGAGAAGLLRGLAHSRPLTRVLAAGSVTAVAVGAWLAMRPADPPPAPRPPAPVRTSVGFATGSARLSDADRRELRLMARRWPDDRPAAVEVTGHTDRSGAGRLDRRLSLQRARAAARYLRGLQPGWSVTVSGVGAATATRVHFRQDRQVTVVVRPMTR